MSDDSDSVNSKDQSTVEIDETPVSSFINDNPSESSCSTKNEDVDDDEEEEDEDEEPIKPQRVRKKTPISLTDDEDYEDEDSIKPIVTKTNARKVIISDDDDDDLDAPGNAEASTRELNGTSNLNETPTNLSSEEERIERKIEKYAFSPKTRKSFGVKRIDSDTEEEDSLAGDSFEDHFKIPDGFSSTMLVPHNAAGWDKSDTDFSKGDNDDADEVRSSDSSLLLVEPDKVPTIQISDDSSVDEGNKENEITGRASVSNKKLIQSKLTDFGKVLVSRQTYDDEVQRLNQMKSQIERQENLHKTVGRTMVDGGEKLLRSINMLKQNADQQRSSIERMQVMEEEKKKEDSKSGPDAKYMNWDELEGRLKSEQPRYVGKQGLKTFENQRAVTLDTLKEIHGSLSTCPPETALLDTPKFVKVDLMAHQRHALAFMKWREQQRPRGGLLADDMGLGKTLTMLSLVAMGLEQAGEDAEADEEEDQEDDNDEQGSGDKKGKTATKWTSRGRRELYPGGTLVLCPASLLQQWEGEVKSKIRRNAMTYLVYHGTNRDSRGRYLSEYDLVISTYSIASVDKKTNIGLYRVKWNRIILDEGHAIRNHKSQMSMAACELVGRRRWLLTGTPIHNKEMDLFAVLKFLRCDPFSDLQYFKKWIDNKTDSGKQRLNAVLKSIMLRRTKAELQTKGELQSLPQKETLVIEVKLDKDEMNVYQRVMIYSRTLFAQFLHQRAEKTADMMAIRNLPTQDPSSVYYNLHKKMVRLNGNTEVQQHQILVLLLRLRQICCHPGLIDAMLDKDESDLAIAEEDEDAEHNSELDLLRQLDKLTIDNAPDTDSSRESSRDDVDQNAKRERILVSSNPVFNLDRPSSKLRSIVEKVEELLKGPDKIVIVSQWSSVLDILEAYTAHRGIVTTKLTGKVNVKDRGAVVDGFNSRNSGPRILYLSLTAGGVGLNLVGANHLFLIDLHWNPQLEKQAQDRIYRFGQEKPVFIYKFMVVDTIEQRIKVLQEHKLAIADTVLTGSKAAAGSKLTIADLKTLFEMN